jgi:uncharacterized protein
MSILFDPAKSMINRERHGYELSNFWGFDPDPVPSTAEDLRFDYGEARYRAFGRINGKAHMIAYTVRDTDLWLISFRRVHEKEARRYGI